MTVLLALLGFLLPLVHRPLLLDGDTYWHLAAGQWMLDHASVPHTDPFSGSAPGIPWVAHEWLSEVLMALAYQAAGWGGLQLLCGAALALTLAVLARYLARWQDQPALLVSCVIALAAIVPSLLARPHLLALAPLAAWCVVLLRAREQERAPGWPWLALMTLWANLHGSFVLGLALAGVLALEALHAAPAPQRWAVTLRWGAFLAGATLATMVTPYGWHGLLYPLQLMRLDLIAYIAEWQPPDFRHPQPLTLALITLLYVALTRPLTIPQARLFIVLALLYMALKHSRHQLVAGVVGVLVLAAPLGRSLGCAPAAAAATAAWRWRAAALTVAVLAVALRLALPVTRTDDQTTPATALAKVPPALLSQPVFNSYELGGYLIYRHVRPFVDGRSDMYGDAFMAAYMAPFSPDRPAFERLVQRYGLRWALIATDSTAMLYLLDTLPGWRRLYGDQVAVVYVRAD